MTCLRKHFLICDHLHQHNDSHVHDLFSDSRAIPSFDEEPCSFPYCCSSSPFSHCSLYEAFFSTTTHFPPLGLAFDCTPQSPPDDVRVYTFKEIESICKRLKEDYIIGIVPRIRADGRCSRTSRAPAGGKDPECNQSSTVKSSRVIESF